MSALYYLSLLLVVFLVLELATGWAVTDDGFTNRKEEFRRYWLSIIIQSIVATVCLIGAALQAFH